MPATESGEDFSIWEFAVPIHIEDCRAIGNPEEPSILEVRVHEQSLQWLSREEIEQTKMTSPRMRSMVSGVFDYFQRFL
ncbi:MAG: hypothetical protein WCX30_03120 [Candidatus Paceibacterota bacterium]